MKVHCQTQSTVNQGLFNGESNISETDRSRVYIRLLLKNHEWRLLADVNHVGRFEQQKHVTLS